MASSSSTKQSFKCRDLPTSTVTLFANRAAIVREIHDIDLKQGVNEVEIVGLTPLVDESSLKVDGSGAATITDMSVSLEPNPENYYDIYPDEDEDDEGDSSDSDSDSDEDSDEVAKLKDELEKTKSQLHAIKEGMSSAQRRLSVLNTYCDKSMPKDLNVEQLEALIKSYGSQRRDLFKEDEALRQEFERVEKLSKEQQKIVDKATKSSRAQKRRMRRQKDKQREKLERKKAAKRQEKQRLRQERAKFWPRSTYKVLVTLEVGVDTPTTLSRRTSMSSVTMSPEKPLKEDVEQLSAGSSSQVSLNISYITSGVSWRPRYDVSFSTVQKTGTITYRAELKNETSETWSEAKIWLSTSQTTFVGVGDECPWLKPWRVQLQKGFGPMTSVLMSTQEQQDAYKKPQWQPWSNNTNRAELFGLPWTVIQRQSQQNRAGAPAAPTDAFLREQSRQHQLLAMKQQGMKCGTMQQPQAYQAAGGLFGSTGNRNAHSAFGNANTSTVPGAFPNANVNTGQGAFGSVEPRTVHHHSSLLEDGEGTDDPTITIEALKDQPTEAIDFEETSFEDHGFTTQFELPGKRTLSPSSDARRHKIATLPFSNLELSTIAVPKLRPAAFLRAKFKNPSSSITLLRGSAGVTLDGSFLGNAILKRASPNELITMPLGVDPAIHISYAKPTVLNSKSGMITKTNAQLCNRSIVVTNTKKEPVTLLVLDQAPTSQDDKLSVDILSPKGLSSVGDVVRTGSNARPQSSGQTAQKWGSARAELKKNGEITWTVSLEKGCACTLPLEFELKAPGDERILTVD